MEEYINNDDKNERRKKQEYLIKHIIEGSYDPDAFSNFLNHEKPDGQNIDNWNLEELETMVHLFKKTAHQQDLDVALHYKLQEIELNDDEKAIYVNRIRTQKRKKTILSGNEAYILVSNIDIVDGGIFSGKFLCFHVEAPVMDIKVRRTEAEFRWLHESLIREFPGVPTPPLLKLSDKFQDVGVLQQYKKFYEKYLNECMRHPELRNSLAFEAFMTSQSKEEFTLKTKEISKYLKQNVLLEKGLTKKTLDSMSADPLELLPTSVGHVDLKISQILKRHFSSVEGQYVQYDSIFDKIEKLSLDYQKYFSRLIAVNKKMKEALLEMQSTAIKFNSAKEVKLKTNLVEDGVYSTVSTYFDNYG